MKPFKEPPNMTTIDLNSSAKIKNIDEDVKKTNNKYSCKIFIPVFLLVICIFTLLAVLILLLLSPFGIHQLPLTREKRALLVFQVPDHPNIESNGDGVSPTGIRTSQNKQKNLDVAEEVHSTQESVISHPCYIPPFLLTNFQHLQQQQQPQLQPQMQMQPQFQSFAATPNNYIPQPNYWGNPTNFYPASMSSPPLQPSYPSAPYFPCFCAPSSAGFPRSSIQEYEDLLTPEPLENLINCPISASGRCNNIVECREEEPNDETACSCREKAGVRVCDGYCDCPHCEDEEGCFGYYLLG